MESGWGVEKAPFQKELILQPVNDAKKKVEEMASVIEKQAFQIEALKRLYKAK